MPAVGKKRGRPTRHNTHRSGRLQVSPRARLRSFTAHPATGFTTYPASVFGRVPGFGLSSRTRLRSLAAYPASVYHRVPGFGLSPRTRLRSITAYPASVYHRVPGFGNHRLQLTLWSAAGGRLQVWSATGNDW